MLKIHLYKHLIVKKYADQGKAWLEYLNALKWLKSYIELNQLNIVKY